MDPFDAFGLADLMSAPIQELDDQQSSEEAPEFQGFSQNVTMMTMPIRLEFSKLDLSDESEVFKDDASQLTSSEDYFVLTSVKSKVSLEETTKLPTEHSCGSEESSVSDVKYTKVDKRFKGNLKGNLSEYIRSIFNREAPSSEVGSIKVRIKAKYNVAIAIPKPCDINHEYVSKLDTMEEKLMKEHEMLGFLSDERISLEEFDKMYRKETILITIMKKRSSKISEALSKKIKIVWLILHLHEKQTELVEVVKNTEELRIEEDGRMTQILKVSSGLPAVYRSPLMRPTKSDFKPGRINPDFMIHVRNFLFLENTTNSYHRFYLAGVLEQEEYTELITRPEEYFLSVLRYLGLSVEEMVDYMYYAIEGGKKTMCRCPCGESINATSYGINIDGHDCKVTKFLKKNFPHMITNEVVRSSDKRIFSQKEAEYICDVFRKRLPKSEWESTPIGRVLKLKMNGREDRILERVDDPILQHNRNCAVRSNCHRCKR